MNALSIKKVCKHIYILRISLYFCILLFVSLCDNIYLYKCLLKLGDIDEDADFIRCISTGYLMFCVVNTFLLHSVIF